MPVTVKTPEQIEKMRVAGRLAAEVLEMLVPHVKPGVTTEELDRLAYEHIVNVQKAVPANVGYKGFPKTLCTSVNHVICHGIPNAGKVLKDGDIVNIDVTVIKDGWHGDTSRMYFAGTPSVLAKRLVDTTLEAMLLGIAQVKPARRSATSAMRSRSMPSVKASRSCASTAATASARSTTRIRRSCTTVIPVPA
jgi:methionyl aminopeptidase